MRSFRWLVLAVVVACGLQPASASAGGSSHTVVLGFGSGYTTPGGTTAIHRGVDIEADPGQRFESVVDGVVTFAGRIPGPHGGSVLAVTISSTQGKVSMMPFEQLLVAKGEAVDTGHAIGRVAASGDPSSDRPHVHLSLRKEDLYVDPAALLVAPAPSPDVPETEPAEVPVVGVVPAPAVTPVPAPAPTVAPVPATGPSAVTIPAGVSVVTAPVASASPVASTAASLRGASARARTATAGDSVAPGVTAAAVEPAGVGVEVVPASPLSGYASAGMAPAQPPLHALLGRLYASSRTIGTLLAHYALTAALLVAAALAAAAVLLSRRAMVRRITSETHVSHRWGTLLQQLRTGDRLRGFTPAPGTLPSQSRGRSAQRR